MRMEPGWLPNRRNAGQAALIGLSGGEARQHTPNLTNQPRKARLRGMANKTDAPRHNEKAFAAILERIMAGESLKQICESEGTPARSTVHLWMANDKTLSDRYARACEVRADHVFDEIFDIADDGRNDWMEKRQGEETVWVENGEAVRRSALRVDARKWALARMQPKKYGDKITHEGTGPEGEIIFKTVYHTKDG